MSGADLSQQLQEYSQQLAQNKRLLSGQKEAQVLCGTSSLCKLENRAIEGDRTKLDSQSGSIRSKVINEIEYEAVTFITAKGQKGGVGQ